MSNPKDSGDVTQAVETLIKLARLVDVANAVKGKVEARASFTSLASVMALLRAPALEENLRRIPGVLGYELSAWSRCATINYDPKVIPMDFWDDFRAIREKPEFEDVVRRRLHALVLSGGGGSSV
jgi:hypothetical protein